MHKRTTLADAMTPAETAFIKGGLPAKEVTTLPSREGPNAAEKTIELREPSDEAEPTTRRRSRGRARQAESHESEILDRVLVHRSMRLQHRTAQALTRAYLEQKLKHAKPDTLQDIAEEAISDWLARNGYLE
jgi:hypothetical protein